MEQIAKIEHQKCLNASSKKVQKVIFIHLKNRMLNNNRLSHRKGNMSILMKSRDDMNVPIYRKLCLSQMNQCEDVTNLLFQWWVPCFSGGYHVPVVGTTCYIQYHPFLGELCLLHVETRPSRPHHLLCLILLCLNVV